MARYVPNLGSEMAGRPFDLATREPSLSSSAMARLLRIKKEWQVVSIFWSLSMIFR